jgi:hypothetical protein
MEPWSAQLEKFNINFFLDTNILCYLIDDTYPALTSFVKALSDMPVVRLYSSEYVLAELFEVRKKENYFHEVLERSKKDGKFINISSFIKYNKRYAIPGYEYQNDLAAAVKEKVDKDIDKITRDFNISFDNSFNDKLLLPMKGICLSTKISREDSLVLVSSVFKSGTEEISERVVLLTGDQDFYNWATSSKDEISSAFNEGKSPDIEFIDSIGSGFTGFEGGTQNLRKKVENVEDLAVRYVMNCLLETYKDSYIGKIIMRDSPNALDNLIAFKARVNIEKQELYLMVLSKTLSFVYCPQPKSKLYHSGRPIDVPFVPVNGNNIVTFVCDKKDETVFDLVNDEGNLVFVHPDSIVE